MKVDRIVKQWSSTEPLTTLEDRNPKVAYDSGSASFKLTSGPWTVTIHELEQRSMTRAGYEFDKEHDSEVVQLALVWRDRLHSELSDCDEVFNRIVTAQLYEAAQQINEEMDSLIIPEEAIDDWLNGETDHLSEGTVTLLEDLHSEVQADLEHRLVKALYGAFESGDFINK